VAGLLFLVRRSLRQHVLSTAITIGAVALASGLVMAVFAIESQTRRAFTGTEIGYDAVLGGRGSELQLVLNSVYHLETSPGNIPWSLYQEVEAKPFVERAVPYAVGDNYQGYRIVGTTAANFTDRFRVRPPGRLFDPERREAVVGSFVAAQTGLGVNSRFHPYHGLDNRVKHEEEYLVVGVLEPTNSPADRVIWIPIEGIWRMSGHVVRIAGAEFEAPPDEDIPDEHKELSAVMLKFTKTGGMAAINLRYDVNMRGKEATLAWPIAAVMKSFFDKFAWVTEILRLVAYLVVIVAMGSILASIYNTMNERRREFAILRSLGARRATVFAVIVAEAATIGLAGAAAGFLVYALILGGAAWLVRVQTGVALEVFAWHPVLWATPLGMMVLGGLAGVLPALKAYATDVAENLTPHS